MKSKIFNILVLTAIWLGATGSAKAYVPDNVWTIPEPQGLVVTTPTFDGAHYCMYSPKSRLFFASDNEWSTRASLTPFAYEIWFENCTEPNAPEGSYELWDNCQHPDRPLGPGACFTEADGSTYVDRNGQANYSWTVTKVGNYYHIQNVTLIANMPEYSGKYFGYKGGGDNRLYMILPEEGIVDWQFVTVDSYETFRHSDSYENYAYAVSIYDTAMQLRDALVAAEAFGINIAPWLPVYNDTSTPQWELEDYTREINELIAAKQELKTLLETAVSLNLNVDTPLAVYNNADATIEDIWEAIYDIKNIIFEGAGDYTEAVGTSQEAWNAWGVCNEQYAPRVTTSDGRTENMMETYEENAYNTGEKMWQLVVDLPNGTYQVELYANAVYTNGRGFSSPMSEGATDVAFLAANDARVYMTAQIGTSVKQNGLYRLCPTVTDGTMRLSMTQEKPGTNWHTIQIKSLRKYNGEPNPDPDWTEMLTNGNAEGSDVTCFVGRDGDNGEDRPARIVSAAGYGGSRAYQVHSIANPANDWDSQFFIYTPDHVWKAGDRYRLSFRVKADTPAHISAQSHTTPGGYIHWQFADGGYDVTTEWQKFDYEGTVTEEQAGENGMQTIAFNLNELRDEDNNYYFDDLSWKSYTGNLPTEATNLSQLNKIQDATVSITSEQGQCYENLSVDVNVNNILSVLGESSLDGVSIYAVQTDGRLDGNYQMGDTDGWRDANGNWKNWTDNIGTAPDFYVKSDFSRSTGQLYAVGGYPGKTDLSVSYTATFAFVKRSSYLHDAVILKVVLNYPDNPEWPEMLVNGNAEGDNVSCFWGRDGENKTEDLHARIVDGAGVNGSRAFNVHTVANATADWDSQFFVYTPKTVWKAGYRYRFTFKVRADKPTHIAVQSHTTPGNYIYWQFADGGYDVTTEWQRFYYEGTVTEEQAGENGMQTIAFILNELRGEDNNFYFDDVSWKGNIANSGTPVDVTSFIANPNFDNASSEGWQGDTPNMVGDGSHGLANVAEHWNHLFNTWQDLNGLPDGKYLLRAKTAFRGSWDDLKNGREPAAKLYAVSDGNTFETPFNNMWSCLNTTPMAGETYFGTWAEEVNVDDGGTVYYIPNDPSAFRLYAEKGYYDTSLYFDVVGGNARIGIKNEDMCGDGCDNWACFDTFTLTYYSNEEPIVDTHDYREFTENTVMLTTVDNINQWKEGLNWIEGGTFLATKNGTINPMNGQEGEGIVTEGIALKNGNDEKKLQTYVTGVESVWAYGCTAGGSDRDLVVTAYDQRGKQVATSRATSSNYQSVMVQLDGLNPSQKYRIDYTGCAVNSDTGADVVLHGIRFVRKYYTDKTFADDNLKYHTTSENTVEVVGYLNVPAVFAIPENVTDGGTSYDVTKIADQAFVGCSTIRRLTLPNTLTTIGNQAFVYTEMTGVVISASVTSIGSQAFQECPNLSTFTVKTSNPAYSSVSGVLFNKDHTTLIRYPSAKTNIYYDIPETVETIDVSAFDGTKNMQYVTIPASVKNAGWAPFHNCLALVTVVCLGETPAELAENSFSSETLVNATLWVPQGTTSAYSKMKPWQAFKTIKPIPTTIAVAAKSQTITYGDKLPAAYEYSIGAGPVCGEPSVSCAATANSNAGTYDIVPEQNTLHSASQLTFTNGTLTIKKATLTVSVGNYTVKQGDPLPEFVIQYSGFVNNQTVKNLTAQAKATCNGTSTSAPGDYPIVLSGAQSPNYEFNYKNGTLSVLAADAIVVKAKSYTITYGEALPKLEYTVEGGQLEGTPTITCNAGNRPAAGVYDIVVSKGTVTNYGATFVNGTLTVEKAPLTVSVGSYTIYANNPIPDFELTYKGFKWNDNANSLTKQPTAYCDARPYSPAGTYPITVSGGESPNYTFTYVDGTLTIKAVYSLTLMSLGNGSIVFKDNKVSSFTKFEVAEAEEVKLSFVPDNGYQVDKVTLDGNDITAKLVNDSYTIKSMNADVSIVASFSESAGTFRENGIWYKIISAPEKTVAVNRNANYKGHLVVPATVDHQDQTWSVVGLTDNAFINCESLISVDLPKSLRATEVGIALFSGCTSLAAITWRPDHAMTSQKLGIVNNPNLLIYVNSEEFAPADIPNVVVKGQAKNITLKDVEGGANFYCPTAFTAASVSYSHSYDMKSGLGEVAGWETLALPFNVQKMEHNVKGTIVPFAKYGGSTEERPFWLYSYGPSGFVKAGSIEANKPYLICMPNHAEYETEYCLDGTVTFSAQNAKVEATSQAAGVTRGNKQFVPVFCKEKKSPLVYALNTMNYALHSDYGSAGSVFVRNLGDVYPFEAYMTTSAASARMVMDIDFADATAIADLQLMAPVAQTLYNLEGLLIIKTNSRSELQQVLNRQPAGVYILNGKKVIKK